MNRTIEYQYSHDIVRRAAWHFLLRWGRSALVAAVIIMLLGLFEVCRGNVTWMTVAALLIPLLLPIRWMSYVKRAATVCDAMPDKSVSVTFTEDLVRFHTSEHDSEFKWSLIKALWKFKTEWLLFTYSKENYTLIPTSDLDSELQDFILTKLKENNTKII
jgi:hypothetical protein